MKKILIYMIKIYQKNLSPVLSKIGINCKFYPSCSEYARQSIEKYGCFIGTAKAIKRILKCNPFSKGGYDPLK